jgi:hypothetical protein
MDRLGCLNLPRAEFLGLRRRLLRTRLMDHLRLGRSGISLAVPVLYGMPSPATRDLGVLARMDRGSHNDAVRPCNRAGQIV